MIFAVCMVKDEADIVETTVSNMASQVDRVILADNGSTDGTLDLLYGLDVDVLEDPEVGYYQSAKMSALAAAAFDQGADWVVPFDADEVWLPRTGPTIKQVLNRVPADALMCEAVVFDHVAVDGHTLSPYRRSEALPLRKVAVRAREGLTIHAGNHGASYDTVRHPLTVTGQLEVRHFPYRSSEQMIRKARNGAAAYAATDLPEDLGAHWRGYGRLSDDQIRSVFREYFWSVDPEAEGLVHDPCLQSKSLSH